MKKQILSIAASLVMVGLVAPASAQTVEQDHDAVHQDLDEAHARLHGAGVEWGPAHEQWHQRAARLHALEHMNEEAIRQQQYYEAPTYYAPPAQAYVVPQTSYVTPAPAYYPPNAYQRPVWGRSWHFSIGW